MKKFTFILLFFVSLAAMAQNDTNEYYWVGFADKTGTPYSVDKPADYLSPRALQRRMRLNIAVDSIDLPVVPNYVKQVAATGAQVFNVSKWLNGTTVIATADEAEKIGELSFVTEVMHINRRAAMVDTTRHNYSAGEELERTKYVIFDSSYYGHGIEQISQLHGQPLHQMGYEGQGVLVGVCDGGFPGVDTLSLFASLRNEGRLKGCRDFVTHNASVFRANDHGTMVLSTMAGNIPGKYVGTAPQANYILCITEDTYTESPFEEYNWVSAAEYLDSMGVDVINSSLGYLGFGDTSLNHHFADLDGNTAPMSIGAEIAASRGILCVNSAGNEGRNGASSISVPADAEHILSVGAVWNNGTLVGFSSYGPTYDSRVKPDVCAQGVLVTVASPMGGYIKANGTSFSSPIMAGMVACLRQACPNGSVVDVWRALRLAGDMADRANNRYGYGIPDCTKALHLLKERSHRHERKK
ncbi:MAG: S8 family serine peptidase [Bacteroidales bacterium]|nr:S8 family serine peptidase [Bacteroidales bacterium]